MARGSGLWIWGLGYLGLSRITRLLLATAGLHTPFCSPQEMTPGPMSTSCALVSTEYEALANDEPFPQKISSMAGRVNWTGDPINFVYSTPPSVHCPPPSPPFLFLLVLPRIAVSQGKKSVLS